MNAQEVIALARGRTIIVGEGHWDRKSLQLASTLVRAADANGYTTLGVERSNNGCIWRGKPWPGLTKKVRDIRLLGNRTLAERHDDGEWRSNLHWHIQLALGLGWSVVAIDPYYWDGLVKRNRFRRRDPGMSRAIKKHVRSICVVGASHLQGIHAHLGDSVLFVNTYCGTRRCDQPKGYIRRFDFYRSVPQLTD